MKELSSPPAWLESLTPAEERAFELLAHELVKAKAKHPLWVSDPIHAAGILNEEAGETMQAAIDLTYSEFTWEMAQKMENEAAQTGAMAVCFIANMHQYSIQDRSIQFDTQDRSLEK